MKALVIPCKCGFINIIESPDKYPDRYLFLTCLRVKPLNCQWCFVIDLKEQKHRIIEREAWNKLGHLMQEAGIELKGRVLS